MTRRTHASGTNLHATRAVRDRLRVRCQIADMRFVDEPDVVGHSVNPLPVDRMRIVPDHTCCHSDLSQRFALVLADHLVTICAKLHRRNAGIGLRRDCPVAERAIHPQTLHLVSNEFS